MSGVKKFVSESEIEEERKKRQEEWERVRKPDQPLEAPEETPFDNRTLYDRLQEQKDKKQAEYEEQHKLKNQVRGLDRDESDFLDFVSQRQQEVEAERRREEEEVLALLRQNVANPVSSRPVSSASSSSSELPVKPATYVGPKKPTQAEILSRVVKRKRGSLDEAPEAKKVKEATTDDGNLSSNSSERSCAPAEGKDATEVRDGSKQSAISSPGESTGALQEPVNSRVIGILPGIGIYDNSSESDTSSSDSEIDTDIFRRSVTKDVEKLIQAANQH